MMRFTQGNWFPKLACLIVAILLWLFIMNDQNPLVEKNYELPVAVENLDSSLVALGVPETVQVRLRMQRNTMLNLREGDLRAGVDLAETRPGVYENTSVMLYLPAGTEILSQSPQRFTLEVEPLVMRTLPVAVHLTGEAAEGRSAQIETITPEQVTISGPQSLVSQVVQLVATVQIAGRRDSFEAVPSVQARDAQNRPVTGLTIAPESVQVAVRAGTATLARELPLTVNVLGEPAAGRRIEEVRITPSRVQVQGQREELEGLRSWELAPVHVDGADRDVVQQVPVPIPDKGQATPQVVEVYVRIARE
ncbi:MAG: CdaR family protein [Veillonellaceae bacterium]|nr:CdaR family protein [Veillonellaceae bacterium]